eukprot:TRINITY_DN6025_c0_g2_i8.p9 TRINITY_DN6025_c0_g2~~TRINITY_DN6025_c0_g2_i8.p9  ORF type:complete len:101 (-),score=8.78 TRINITY_DN6025_c0_g2_i8:1171-1473(-)
MGPKPLPVATKTTFGNNFCTKAIPATGTPLIQTCEGGSSMNFPVQSPAREMINRYPDLPGDGMHAKGCHSAKGFRLIAIVAPGKALLPQSRFVIIACEDG